MLPPANRLTRSADFASTVRSGRRVRSGALVVHLRGTDTNRGVGAEGAGAPSLQPRVGFVVSKAVGSSVVRHRVTRRLRANVRSRLAQLPAGSHMVVRALPEAADAPFAALGADIERAVANLVRS